MGEGAAEQTTRRARRKVSAKASAGSRNGSATIAACPASPTSSSGPDGAPRAVWSRFLDAFGALAPDEIERRFGMADRHIRDTGVTYRAPATAPTGPGRSAICRC